MATKITADKLNGVMEPDHVIRVLADGTVEEPRGVYAPSVYVDCDEDGQISDADDAAMIEQLAADGWEVLNGWSGQQGYSGPIMHTSEYIGGALADHILSTPGLYVATTVETLDDSEEPAGWVVLHRAEEEPQEAEEATTVKEPREFRGLTRADVAEEAARALETLSAEDRATVEGKAPSVILGMAFRRAQTAWCNPWRADRTPEESAAYERCANIASAALIFERADDPEAAEVARTDDWRITTAERAEEDRRRTEARAAALVAEWRGAERHGKYLVRTEEAGHGIVRVFVRGAANEVESITRAQSAYARANGLREGGAAGGGEFFEGDYIAQRAYNRA